MSTCTFRGRLFAAVTTAAIAGLCAAASAAGIAAAEDSAVRKDTLVKMTSARKFEPARVEVKVGDTVVWLNDSMAVHTVTADPSRAKKSDNVVLPEGVQPFSSQHILPSSYYRHTFTAPGTYRYFDINAEDQGMVGEVVVR